MKDQKTIKVLDSPLTYISIDADADVETAKKKWLKKYHENKNLLGEEQRRKESQTIRGGRIWQRNKYKKK